MPTMLLAALATLPLLPAIAALGRGAKLAIALPLLGALASGALAWTRPAFDDATPRPLNLLLAGEAGKPSRLLASPLAEPPAGFLRAQGFQAEATAALPFSGRNYHTGGEGPVLPAPEVDVLADTVQENRRHVEVRLRPAHPGDTLTLHLPDTVEQASVRVDGEPLSESRWPWWHGVTLMAVPAEGRRITFAAPAEQVQELYVVGESMGLPDSFMMVAAARSEVASQIQGGDRTVGWRKVVWPAMGGRP